MKKVRFGKLAGISFLLAFGIPSLGVVVGVGDGLLWEGIMSLSLALLWLSVISFIAWLIAIWRTGTERRKAKRAERKARKDELREQHRKKREEYNSPENKAKREEQHRIALEYERKRKIADRTVISAVLISTNNKKSAAGAAGRAVVGGALLGPVGAIAGAASGSSKATKATFSVKYASGRTATETVDIHSKRFRELSALLHD